MLVLGLENDSSSKDNPPVARNLFVDAAGICEVVVVEFTVENDDAGTLEAIVEYEVVSDGPNPQYVPLPATSVEARSDTRSRMAVSAGELVAFRWDAPADLGPSSATVRIVVTPFEDGVAANPVRSRPVRAGNSPASIFALDLFSRDDLVQAVFTLSDVESDPAELVFVEAEVAGDRFEVPLGIVDRRNFPTSPTGQRVTFGFSVFELDHALLAGPGFVGEVLVRAGIRECPNQEPAIGEGRFEFDNNDAPFAELLATPDVALESGIVPIRFRLFDRELNPASVRFEVDIGDGLGLLPACEFAVAESDGTRDLPTLPRAAFGNPGNPTHTFLWDSLAHDVDPARAIVFAVTPEDYEEGPSTSLGIERLFRPGLEQRWSAEIGEIPSLLATGDVDANGSSDLVVGTTSGLLFPLLVAGESVLRADGIRFDGTLTALLAGRFNEDDYVDVVAATTDPDRVSFFGGGPSGLARIPIFFPLDGDPRALEATDLDGDGTDEIIVAVASDDAVLVIGFAGQALSEGPTGDSPRRLAVGRLDADPFPEVVVGNWNDKSLTVFFGSDHGSAQLGEPHEVSLGGRPDSIACGDFDGDGTHEIVAALTFSDQLVHVRYDSTNERFETTSLSQGDRLVKLACGDFDADGHDDVVVANWTSDAVDFHRGSPNGLVRAVSFAAGTDPSDLTSGDFDGDSYQDVVAASPFTVTFLRGGPRGLQRVGAHETSDRSILLASDDFRGDGVAEVAVAFRSGRLSVFRGGRSGLTHVEELPSRPHPRVLTTNDFDRDGFDDLSVATIAEGYLSCYEGGPGGLRWTRDFETGLDPQTIVSADFNGDGYPDVITGNQVSRDLSYFVGSPEGLRRVREFGVDDVELSPVDLVALHLDRDRFVDLVVANATTRTLLPLRGGPDRFEVQNAIPLAGTPADLDAGDFNADGITDVVSIQAQPSRVTVFLGNGTDLAHAGMFPAGDIPDHLAVGDFNADGFDDVAVANRQSGDLSTFRGGPRGLSLDDESPELGLTPRYVAVADVDGDGFDDVLVANRGSHDVSFLRGGPSGLRHVEEIPAGNGPWTLLIRDFDADGWRDVVVTNVIGNTLTILRGSVAGLRRADDFLSGSHPAAIVGGDFDADGFEDVALVNENSANVTTVRTHYFSPHASALVEPHGVTRMVEPRTPPRFRLESLTNPREDEATRVTMLPGVTFPISPKVLRDTAERGATLRVVVHPVRVFPSGIELATPARLTFRLRETGEDLEGLQDLTPSEHAARLRVFRLDETLGTGVLESRAFSDLEVTEVTTPDETFREVGFSIDRFGHYQVAEECP